MPQSFRAYLASGKCTVNFTVTRSDLTSFSHSVRANCWAGVAASSAIVCFSRTMGNLLGGTKVATVATLGIFLPPSPLERPIQERDIFGLFGIWKGRRAKLLLRGA